ncbi:helix-turn-helix transcriptional regulator [Dactylosporangium roseum]|uniref:Helix-turn-helix transcriptional regulator n=1 Tax=Dactylosporangium roseum TaxID=47989 RepID=A0ABY5Z6W6_9ACTN|nr:helix-turn-helix transcriptional regulator [Dactylosporangium roseum]UWZ37790.1 helix-turn-helix transcriptional regulator [Dactylosporangium roseum]
MSTKAILSLMAARQHAESGSGRTIRQRAKLSMNEVCGAIGVTVGALSRWENGLAVPRGEPAIRWAELLGELEQALDGRAARKSTKPAKAA